MRLRGLVGMMAACVVMLTSCDVLMSSLSNTANMMNCKYEYNSISAVSVAGIVPSEGVSVGNALKITSLVAQLSNAGSLQSLPLNFTLNVNVTNPNTTVAAMSKLDYIVSVDDVQLTQGSTAQNFSVAAGETGTMPLTIAVDAVKLLSGEGAGAITELAKNLLGVGTKASNINLQLRPSFDINGIPMPIPTYVPVSFEIGK